MSAEVLSKLEIPAAVLPSFPKVCKDKNRQPFPSRQVRHTKALYRALQQDSTYFLESLLEGGVCANLRLEANSRVTTPLHISIENGNDQMTLLLLYYGADCDVTDSEGLTPLDVAYRKRNFGVIQLLVRHGASLLRAEVRVACLGLTFYNLMTRDDDLDIDLYISLTSTLLDHGFARGWNGINCSFAYLNRVYNQHKRIFLLLLQASSDCQDDVFTQSCFSVLYRRRDAESLNKLHRHGHSKMAASLKRKHVHSGSGVCRLEALSSPCPLMGLSRVAIRQHLRQFSGSISRRLLELPLPASIRRYLDFME